MGIVRKSPSGKNIGFSIDSVVQGQLTSGTFPQGATTVVIERELDIEEFLHATAEFTGVSSGAALSARYFLRAFGPGAESGVELVGRTRSFFTGVQLSGNLVYGAQKIDLPFNLPGRFNIQLAVTVDPGANDLIVPPNSGASLVLIGG